MSPSAAGLPLPSPRVAAALVLAMLGAGVVIGRNVDDADAGAGRRVVVVYGPPAPSPLVAPAATPPTMTPPAEPTDLGEDPGAGGVPDDGAVDPPAAPGGDTGTGGAGGAPDDGAVNPPGDSGADHGAGGSSDEEAADPPAMPAPKLPPIAHVWVVALTGHSASETFGADSPSPHLAQELRAKGTLLPWYHAAGHDPAAGGVALLGGQRDALGPFDAEVPTLPGQLTEAGRTWKAYVEGVADGLQPGDDPCARPADEQPRNPFLRFASITTASECASLLAAPEQLPSDLEDPESTPAFSYILPGPEHDGSSGLAAADAWLRDTVEPILASKAYNDGGLLVITFDAGAPEDQEAGGGRTGALVLSPFVTAGGTVETPHDPFSLLRSIEDLFALEPLGYAADTKIPPFGRKVYASYDPEALPASGRR